MFFVRFLIVLGFLALSITSHAHTSQNAENLSATPPPASNDAEAEAASANPLALPIRATLSDFEDRVQTALARDVAPGFVFAVVEDGKVIFAKGYGLADIDKQTPASPETVFPLGSISKTFIGSAAGIAIHEGRFDPQKPISGYLSFEISDPRENGKRMSFLHLATHTSGVVDHDPAYEAAYAYNTLRHPQSLREYLRSYLTKGGALYSPKANFASAPPGTQHAYSNIASALAAQALSDALQVPFDTYTRERIFGPLSMNSTGWFSSDIQPEKLGRLYERTTDGFKPLPPYALATWPDGGLRSSANDLARYLIAFSDLGRIDAKQVISRDAVQIATMGLDLSKVANTDPEEIGTGLFWGTQLAPTALQSRPMLGHNGVDPGIWTFMQYDLMSRRGVIAFANADLTNAEEIRGFYSLAYRLFITEIEPR